MKINKIFEAIAKSKVGQKFYTFCSKNETRERLINNVAPTTETALSTIIYCWSTAKADLPEEQRSLLQWQNVLSGGAGMVLGTAANHWVSKQTDKIAKDLDPKVMDVKTLRKTSTGLRIFGPMLLTAGLMRWIAPTATSVISTKIMQNKREKQAKQKLDVKA